MPAWIPVLFGIITPLAFTANGILIKHLTSESVGFDSSRASSSVFFIGNFVILCVAIPYWYYVEFHQELFYIGFIVGMID